ncbi:putative uncharacterized protein [Clostridium sp. CAG:451]|nr:putative uncharacterized protein [Clostridium sp. CAG:451]
MKLYLICGKARAGKDTFAKLIKQEEEKDNNKVCILKLTAPLYSWAEDYFNYDKEKDEKPRELLQTLGYDILQLKLKKKDFLLDYLITTIEVLDNYYDVGLITDGRLVHEIEVLKEKYPNIKTILLTNKQDNKLTNKEKNHQTEIDLDDYKDFDYIVENKDMESLKLETLKIVEDKR